MTNKGQTVAPTLRGPMHLSELKCGYVVDIEHHYELRCGKEGRLLWLDAQQKPVAVTCAKHSTKAGEQYAARHGISRFVLVGEA